MSVTYPDVPIIDGVPPVLRIATAQADAEQALAAADEYDAQDLDAASAWGVFDSSGQAVLFPDSIATFEHGAEFRISDYPLERGGFESFNKVATPFDVRLAMTKGGAIADRNAFLTAVALLHASTDLYSIVTPERTYLDVNLVQYGQTRSALNGANLLTVTMQWREVRQTATIAYSATPLDPTVTPAPTPLTAGTTKAPAAVKKVSQGAVQAKTGPSFDAADVKAAQRLGLTLVGG